MALQPTKPDALYDATHILLDPLPAAERAELERYLNTGMAQPIDPKATTRLRHAPRRPPPSR